MNRNTLIFVIVIVILALLGVWYYSQSNLAITPASSDVKATDTKASAPAATPSTFKSIFTQSGNHQCTYEQLSPSSRSSSVIYIADGKMRGEFRTLAPSASANIMIYANGYLYSWREGATVAKRSSIKSIAELPQIIPTDLTSGAVYGVSDENVSWDCHDWLKDTEMFVVPSELKISIS
jgi:hypothetical protein